MILRALHGAVWSLLDEDQDDELTASEELTLASYVAGPPVDAYLVRLAVGDPLPETPLFSKLSVTSMFLSRRRTGRRFMESLYTREIRAGLGMGREHFSTRGVFKIVGWVVISESVFECGSCWVKTQPTRGSDPRRNRKSLPASTLTASSRSLHAGPRKKRSLERKEQPFSFLVIRPSWRSRQVRGEEFALTAATLATTTWPSSWGSFLWRSWASS